MQHMKYYDFHRLLGFEHEIYSIVIRDWILQQVLVKTEQKNGRERVVLLFVEVIFCNQLLISFNLYM